MSMDSLKHGKTSGDDLLAHVEKLHSSGTLMESEPDDHANGLASHDKLADEIIANLSTSSSESELESPSDSPRDHSPHDEDARFDAGAVDNIEEGDYINKIHVSGEEDDKRSSDSRDSRQEDYFHHAGCDREDDAEDINDDDEEYENEYEDPEHPRRELRGDYLLRHMNSSSADSNDPNELQDHDFDEPRDPHFASHSRRRFSKDSDHHDGEDEPFSPYSPPFDHSNNNLNSLESPFDEALKQNLMSSSRHAGKGKSSNLSGQIGLNEVDDDDEGDGELQEAHLIATAAAAAVVDPPLRIRTTYDDDDQEEEEEDDDDNANVADNDDELDLAARDKLSGMQERHFKNKSFIQAKPFPRAAGNTVPAESPKPSPSIKTDFDAGRVRSSSESSLHVLKAPGRKRPSTVATYFTITGINWRAAMKKGPIAKLDLLDPDFCAGLPATIKDRYPSYDYTDLPLNPQLCQFCHPIGMAIKQGGVGRDAELNRVQEYSFLMTDASHKMTHATCLSFYDVVPSKIKSRLVDITLDQVLRRDRTRSDWITRSFTEYLASHCPAEDEMVWFKFCQQFDSIVRELEDAADSPDQQMRFNRLLDGYIQHYRGPMENLMEPEYIESLAKIVTKQKEEDEKATLAEFESEEANEDAQVSPTANNTDASSPETEVDQIRHDDLENNDDDNDSVPSLVSLDDANILGTIKENNTNAEKGETIQGVEQPHSPLTSMSSPNDTLSPCTPSPAVGGAPSDMEAFVEAYVDKQAEQAHEILQVPGSEISSVDQAMSTHDSQGQLVTSLDTQSQVNISPLTSSSSLPKSAADEFAGDVDFDSSLNYNNGEVFDGNTETINRCEGNNSNDGVHECYENNEDEPLPAPPPTPLSPASLSTADTATPSASISIGGASTLDDTEPRKSRPEDELAVQYCREIRMAAMQALKDRFTSFSNEKLARWDPYEPKCITFVSPFPFYTLFGAVLRELLRLVRDKDALPVPLERCIQHVLLEVPEPPPGKYRVRFKLHEDMPYYFTCSKPPLNRLPLLNVPLRPLFESLGGQNLLNLFSALILEFSVLLVTSRLDLLSNSITGLLSLLWPLKWQGNVVPVLPNNPQMMELVHSPVPIIIGIHRSQVPRDPSIRDSVVFVDLDENTVELPRDRDLPIMPSRSLKKLWDALRGVVYINTGTDKPIEKSKRSSIGGYSMRERRNSRRRRTQRYSDTSAASDLSSGLDPAGPGRIVTDFLEEDVSKQTLPVLEASTQDFNNAVRKIFLEFFVSLIGDYRWYMGGLEEDGDELIDRESFLRDHKDSATSREFLNEFISTQMMQSFFDSRVFAAEHNFEIMLFDAWIDHLGQARTTPPPSVLANSVNMVDPVSANEGDGNAPSYSKHTIKASFLDDTSQADRSNYDVAPPSAEDYEGAAHFKMNSRTFPDTLHWRGLPSPRAVPSLIRARRGSHLLRNVDKVSHVLESVNLSFFTKERLFRARFSLVKRYARAGLQDVKELSNVIDNLIRHLEEYAGTMDKAFKDTEGKLRARALDPSLEPNPYMRSTVWPGVVQESEQHTKLCRDMAGELTINLSYSLKEVIRALGNSYDILVESEVKHMSAISSRKTAMELSKKNKEIALLEYTKIEKAFTEMQEQLQRQNLEEKRMHQATAMSKYYRSATPSTRKKRRGKRRSGVGEPLEAILGNTSPGTPSRRESITSGHTPASGGSMDATHHSWVGMSDLHNDLASPQSFQSRFVNLGSPRSDHSLPTGARSEGSVYSANSVASADDLFDRQWYDDDAGQGGEEYMRDEDEMSQSGDLEGSLPQEPPEVLRIDGTETSFPKELSSAGNSTHGMGSDSKSLSQNSPTDDVGLNMALAGAFSQSARLPRHTSNRRASGSVLSKQRLIAGSQRHRRRSDMAGLAGGMNPSDSLRSIIQSQSSREDNDNDDTATESSATESRVGDTLPSVSPVGMAVSRLPEPPRVQHISSSELARMVDRKVAAKRTLRAARLQFAQDVASLTRELTTFTEANSLNLQIFHRNERTRIKNVKLLLKELMSILRRWMVRRREQSFAQLHGSLLSPIWRTSPESTENDPSSLTSRTVTEEPKSAVSNATISSTTSNPEQVSGTSEAKETSGEGAVSTGSGADRDECSSKPESALSSSSVQQEPKSSSSTGVHSTSSSSSKASASDPYAEQMEWKYPFRESLPTLETHEYKTDADREAVFTEWREWMSNASNLYRTNVEFGGYRATAMRSLARKFGETVDGLEVGRGFQKKNAKLSTLQEALVTVKDCLIIISGTISSDAEMLEKIVVRMSERTRKRLTDISTKLGHGHDDMAERVRTATQNAQKADQQLAAKAADKDKILQDLARTAQEARELQEHVVGLQSPDSSLLASPSTGFSSIGTAPGIGASASGNSMSALDLNGTNNTNLERTVSEDHSMTQQRAKLRSAVKRVLKNTDGDRVAHALKKQERLAKKLQDVAEEETNLSLDRNKKHSALGDVTEEYRRWMDDAFAKFRSIEIERVSVTVRHLNAFVEGLRASIEGTRSTIIDHAVAVQQVDPQEDLRKHKELDERTKRYLDDALDHFSRHPSMAGMIPSTADNQQQLMSPQTDGVRTPGSNIIGVNVPSTAGSSEDGPSTSPGKTVGEDALVRRTARFDSVDSVTLEGRLFAVYMRTSLGPLMLRFNEIKIRLKSMQKHTEGLSKSQKKATHDLDKLCAQLGVVPLNMLERRREVDPFDDLFLRTFLSMCNEMDELTTLESSISKLSMDARTSKRTLHNDLLEYAKSKDRAVSTLQNARDRYSSTLHQWNQLEHDTTSFEDELRNSSFRSRLEKERKQAKLFELRNRREKAKKDFEEAKTRFEGSRQVYETCFSQLLVSMQSGYIDSLSSCLQYLQTFVESVQNVALKYAQASPFMQRKSRALETTYEPIVFEGDNDAVLDLAAMDTNGFFDSTTRFSREAESASQGYASSSTGGEEGRISGSEGPIRSLSASMYTASRTDRAVRESIRSLGGATMMASSLKQSLSATSAAVQLAKMFTSPRHSFLTRPVAADTPEQRERPVCCDEVETVILHSKLICEALLEVIPERLTVSKTVLNSALDEVKLHPMLSLSKREQIKKQKQLATAGQASAFMADGTADASNPEAFVDVDGLGAVSTPGSGTPNPGGSARSSRSSDTAVKRSSSTKSSASSNPMNLDSFLHPRRSVAKIGHRLRQFVPLSSSSSLSHSSLSSMSKPLEESVSDGVVKQEMEHWATASELDTKTLGVGEPSSALTHVLGQNVQLSVQGSSPVVGKDTYENAEFVSHEVNTLFVAIAKVHKSWEAQVVSALECVESSDMTMINSLRKMADTCQGYLREIYEIRTNLRRKGNTVRAAVARANEKVEEARHALDECEQKEYHRNLLTQEAGKDRKQRKISAAKRKLEAEEANKLAADDKLADFQRFYRNEAARVMHIYDRLERHQFSFLISLNDNLKFWHRRLAEKLEALAALSQQALSTVDLQADLQSFVDANKIQYPSGQPLPLHDLSTLAATMSSDMDRDMDLQPPLGDRAGASTTLKSVNDAKEQEFQNTTENAEPKTSGVLPSLIKSPVSSASRQGLKSKPEEEKKTSL